ncbi:MAG TPA: hypothetical protein ENI61_04420 [Ignavibacteria bacterium]|nr:hypothetical protein [Ignavibacteria bacterium]
MRYNIHHIHRRKRIYKKLEKYPSKNKGIKFLDKFLLIIAVIGPLVTLPQIIKIFTLKDATGISVISWSLFAILDIPWIVYGFVHKEKPIIISSILWFILNIIVVFGALRYG